MFTKRHFVISSVVVVSILSLALPAFAGNGNSMPSGSHYEFGLIGRPNNYNGSGTDNSNRHNIFIPLDTQGYVDGKVKLYMIQGSEFKVVDGDATGDGVAKFQIGPGYYAVFIRALGKPGGNLFFSAWFTYWMDEQETQLSDAIWLGNVAVGRVAGKPKTVEISKVFYYSGPLCYDTDSDPCTPLVCDTVSNAWVFDIPGFYEYWWDITNDGLKRLEVRFYPVDEGYVPPPLPPPDPRP